MFDKTLVLSILQQIDEALETIQSRSAHIQNPNDFTSSPAGKEKMDGICMLFSAVGEALKHIDRITTGSLLSRHPEIDWKGAIGFRDIIAHHYFDIDSEQVFWICSNKVKPLSMTIKKMIEGLR